MDFPSLFGFDDALFVDRFADDVHNATEHFFTDGNRNAATRIFNRHAANETVGRVHGNRANDVLADVLRDFEHQITCLIADRRIREAPYKSPAIRLRTIRRRQDQLPEEPYHDLYVSLGSFELPARIEMNMNSIIMITFYKPPAMYEFDISPTAY